jgi:hypothetical protein
MSKKSRREVLKGIAVGAPVVWAKPVVDSVVLPVHADTSPQTGSPCPPPCPKYTGPCENPDGLIAANEVYDILVNGCCSQSQQSTAECFAEIDFCDTYNLSVAIACGG